MDSIQRLRHSAYNEGNLQSTPQQQVIDDGGYVEIVPADPQVIYVPVYQPDQVYYQTCYGPPFITFGVGFPIGLWLNCDFDWGTTTSLSGAATIRVRPIGGMSRTVMGTRVTQPSGISDDYPGARGANHGDRGWGVADNRTAVATPTRGCHGKPVLSEFSGAATDRPAPASPTFDARRPAHAGSR